MGSMMEKKFRPNHKIVLEKIEKVQNSQLLVFFGVIVSTSSGTAKSFDIEIGACSGNWLKILIRWPCGTKHVIARLAVSDILNAKRGREQTARKPRTK